MRAIVLSIVFLLCASAFAQEKLDSRSLFQACRAAVKQADGEKVSAQEASDAGFCGGYIIGLNEGLRSAVERTKVKYCLPSGLTGEQIVRVVEKYLRENPQELHKPMRTNAIAAFAKAFPCK
jgi:hypothetical protein